MKTNKKNATTSTITIDFSSLNEAMTQSWNSNVTLSDMVTCLWNEVREGFVSMQEFRKQFIGWATSKKGGSYSEDWAKHVLLEAGIRVRSQRSDSGTRKPAAGKPATAASFLATIRAAKMTKAEIVKLIAGLASL